MRSRVREKFKFESAHALLLGETLEEMHGHTYHLEVVVEGEVEEGYVIDFLELRRIVEREVIEKLDHRNLNKIFPNPTTENIALWIGKRIEEALPERLKLHKVILWEGDENGVEFEF